MGVKTGVKIFSKAHTVGVGGVNRSGPARVDGLDLDDPDSPGAVKAKQHQVRDVPARSPRALHPLRESSRRGAPEVGEHVLTAEGSREEGGKDLDDRAVAGGLQPHPVHALHEVKRAQGGEGGVRDRGLTGGTGKGGVGAGCSGGKGKQVEGEGTGEVGRVAEGKEGRRLGGGGEGDVLRRPLNGHSAPEGEGAACDAAVKKAGTADRGGGVVEGQELKRRDDCRSSSLSVWVARLVEEVKAH